MEWGILFGLMLAIFETGQINLTGRKAHGTQNKRHCIKDS